MYESLRCTGGLSISGEAPNLLSFSANLVQSQVEEAKVILAQTLLLQFQQAPDNDLKLLYFIFIVEPPPTKGAGGRPQTFKRTTWWRLLSQHTFHCEWQVTYNRKDPNVNSDMYVLVILVILIIKEIKNTQCYVSFVHRSPLATSSSGKLLVHQFILSIRCSMYRGGIPPTTQR